MSLVFGGNKDVIALLERMLEHAKKGRSRYAGVLICDEPNQIFLETAGASDMEDQLPGVLDEFKARIEPRVDNRNLPPPRNELLGYDNVCYNAASMPISYDFVPWLVLQEMRRRKAGAKAPLKVGFWFGQDGESGLETRYRSTMFQYVVEPMLKLIGAVEDRKAVGGIYDQGEGFQPRIALVKAARAGEEIPRLTSSKERLSEIHQHLLHGDKPITITLREASHWRHRNSNTKAWMAFANDLKLYGKRVIFIRDTAKANEPMGIFETCPMASVHLEVRMALYESAECNFFVSNGPLELALFGSRPFLQFIALEDEGPFAAGTSQWWRETCAINPGEQFPWQLPGQQIIWGLDTYENITEAWNNLKLNREDAA